MTSFRRSPRPAMLAFERIRQELVPQTPLAAVQTAWSTVVGSAIAREAQPTAYRGGILTVSCSAAVWAQELDLMGPQILERLNGLSGGPQIMRLRCVALPVPGA